MLRAIKVKHLLFGIISLVLVSVFSPTQFFSGLTTIVPGFSLHFVQPKQDGSTTAVSLLSDKARSIGLSQYKTGTVVSNYFSDSFSSLFYSLASVINSFGIGPVSDRSEKITKQYGVSVILKPVTKHVYAVYFEHENWVKALNISFSTITDLPITRIVGGMTYDKQFPIQLSNDARSITGKRKNIAMLKPGKQLLCYIVTQTSDVIDVDHITYFGDPHKSTSFFRGS